MDKIRIKNDINVFWAIFSDEASEVPYDLTGRDISVYLTGPMGRVRVENYEADGNIIKWVFRGKDQEYTGIYSFELVENEDQDNMHTLDKWHAVQLYDPCDDEDYPYDECECDDTYRRDAFELVAHTEETSEDLDDDFEIVTLRLNSSWGSQLVEIIDNLDSDNANAALSARQGKVLLEKVTAVGTQLTKVEQQVIPQLTKVLDTLTGGVEVDGSVDNKIRRSVTIGSLD